METLIDSAGFVCFDSNFEPWELLSNDYNSVIGETIRMGSKFDEMNFEIEYLRDMYGIAMRDLTLAEQSIEAMKNRIDFILKSFSEGNGDIEFAVSELKEMCYWKS
jgi:hypothetical protein